MCKFLLFVKGERGLYSRDGNGKMYFQHRSSNFNEGVVRVDRELDKGNYSFISGENVTSLGTLQDIKVISAETLNILSESFIYHIDGYDLFIKSEEVYLKNKGKYWVYACVDGELVFVYSDIRSLDYKIRKADRFNVNVFLNLLVGYAEEIPSRDSLYEYAVRCIARYYWNDVSIRLISGKVLKINNNTYIIYRGGKFLTFTLKYFNFLYLEESSGESGEDLKPELEDFIKKYHICLWKSSSEDKVLVSSPVRLKGETLAWLNFIVSSNFSFENYEKHKEEIEKSFEEYDKIRKNIAKNISVKSIDLLRSISYRKIQFGIY